MENSYTRHSFDYPSQFTNAETGEHFILHSTALKEGESELKHVIYMTKDGLVHMIIENDG